MASTLPVRRYATDPLKAARHLLGWMRNPVSIHGPRNLRRFLFAAAGPTRQRQVEEMRAHPEGARILVDRPDLARALSDMTALAAMPAGSLGRAYHDFMSHPEAIPTYVLGAALFENGEFDALDWSADMKFLTARLNYIHDLTHIVSGYGTDLIQEALNILFNVGFEGTPRPGAEAITALFGLIGLPRVGWRRWRSLCLEAFARGRAMRQAVPFHCIYWEELLPLPLDAVRARLGVAPLSGKLETRDWIRNPLGRAMAKGYGRSGDAAANARFKRLVERIGGIDADPRDIAALMGLGPALGDRLHGAVAAGADEAAVRAIAGLPPRRGSGGQA